MGGPLRLRSRRAAHAGRRSGRWRIPVSGGIFALVIGAACWAPLAPTALAPLTSGDQPAAMPVVAVGAGAVSAAPVVAAPVLSVPLAPTPAPSATPQPVVVPTVTAAGQALLGSVKSDRTAQWVKNHTETAFRSGPNEDSVVFTHLPQWSTLKQIDSRPDWLFAQYAGDGDTRQPGVGWVKASDVGGVDPPAIWLSSARSGSIWSAADAAGKRTLDVPLPGDGRTVPPSQGWVDGDTLARTRTPSLGDLPWAYPDDLRADVRIN